MKRIGFLIVFLAFVCILRAQSPQPHLVADFSEQDLQTMLDLCHQGGFEWLVVKTPFSTYGHYEWNGSFAPDGDLSVRRMVQAAKDQEVTLGLLVQEDAISLNDAYFTSKNFNQFQRSEQLMLFDEMDAEDVDFALYRNEALKSLTSLNLLQIDDEIVSIGTMELAGDLVLLHRCSRGLYGTQRTHHGVNAKVYRIWDSPDRFVIPDGELREAVRQRLAERLEAGNVSLVLLKGAPGQEILDKSIRVRQVERWTEEGVANNTLGWVMIHASDKKRTATSVEDLEWMLSKASAYNASYGMLLDPNALKNLGTMPDMLALMKQWNQLIRSDVFTASQKEMMKDPYLDWHLEQQGDSLFMLYSMNFSRRYQCAFQEVDTGFLKSEQWVWNVEEDGRFGLRLNVEGEVEIANPMINTSEGLVMFPCTLEPGQQLMYDFGDYAYVMDANYNKLKTISVEGLSELAQGDNEVTFFCEVDPSAEQHPVVKLRYITREQSFVIHPHK